MGSLFSAQGITSTPQSASNVTSGIATWAQPYINNYLTQAQNLAGSGGAGPNALMQQSYTNAANMQTPGQFGQATNLFNQTGSAAQQVGQNYANMATNPNAVSAYMNPYIQQSLAPQLALLNQQQALQGQNIQSQATGAGAFGGNREALAQGLNAQNYGLAEQQAIGQGYNTAYNNAIQNMQYGANLGLQGLNTANQAASGLAGTGAAQNTANLGIANLQNTLGQQQYNLPYQNLQFLQGMMSGLPYTTQQTQGYQAAPNTLSQVAGLGTSLVGGYGLYNKLFGGNNPSTPTTPTSDGTNTSYDTTTDYSSVVPNSGYSGSISPEDLNISPLAKGGRIKEKKYAGGGKVGSDLADLQLHKLVG
jgi:hypothetical protein